MQTGENEQALRKILDMTRLISITFLVLHFYYYCYTAFEQWHLTMTFTDRLISNISNTGLFHNFLTSKLFALGFLFISLIGARGRKDEKLRFKKAFTCIIIGLSLYFLSYVFLLSKLTLTATAILYITITAIGFMLVLSGGVLLSRVIQIKLNSKDIFNKENETFPQQEKLLTNEFSINLHAEYYFKGKKRKSWINIINPFRALMVLGSPGSGKSYFVIRHVITQHIKKGYTMFVYDFKFDDLSKIVYNTWLKYKSKYPVEPEFCVINFDDLSRSHRCNPLDHETMSDITDAAESARTILMGLNREWIKRQGDFFVESPINFLTAIIWYLRKYNDGEFCTLPHVIELMQADYKDLFTILRTEKEIDVLINPFVNAFLNNVMEQLEGQIASAKVAMARLSSPQLYYVLSGNDFMLDINNPDKPKIVCMGNNPQKIQIYGAVLSLYVNRLVKLVNKKGKQKSSLIFDEFPTIYLNNVDSLIATARSNKVATCLGIQDFSQLRKDYGKEQADVIMNITGNIISGQVTGDTAKQLSERFGKIMLDKQEEVDKSLIKDAKDNISKAMTELRDIAKSLSSDRIQSFDLIQGIKDEVNRINRSGLINASINVNGSQHHLKSQHKIILFRLIQESMQNILKHAKASEISISIVDFNNKAGIIISDNGIGFDVDTELKNDSGLGLKNIINRAALIGGEATIQSTRNHGTTISIMIPHD